MSSSAEPGELFPPAEQHVRVPMSVIADSELSRNAKWVYVVMLSYADSSGLCWPSYQQIAERAGMSRRTAVDACRELENAELLSRSRRMNGKTSNLWITRVMSTSRATRALPSATRALPSAKFAHRTKSKNLIQEPARGTASPGEVCVCGEIAAGYTDQPCLLHPRQRAATIGSIAEAEQESML